MRTVKFNQLSLKNFKSHQVLTVNFGERTVITGDNAKGKSSIMEAVSWLLYGTDPLGSKTDPTPVTYDADETVVLLLLNVDHKDLLLGRELKKGKTKYYINEVPSKATEFNELVAELFDKELFMSLFNPSYFFTLHWEKQRAMVMQYVTAPANKEVLKELPKPQADKLSELVKKHSLDDLQKLHRDNKNKMDKAYIAAQSRTKTLKEQLNLIGIVEGDPAKLNDKLQQLTEEIEEADKVPSEAFANNQKYNQLQTELNMVQQQINVSKEKWPLLKNEPIEDVCRTCKQPLQNEAVEAVIADKERRMNEYKANHQKLLDKKKELQEKLATMKFIDVTEEQAKVRELESERDKVADLIRKHEQHEQLLTQIQAAEKDEQDKLTSLNDSIFVLDAIKAFRAKEAELQANKVQDLFDTLSIKLFETVKTTGDMKPTFEIMMDGKEYKRLSLSESIRAGLELREVLSEQSQLVTPVFVDNAESITRFKQPMDS